MLKLGMYSNKALLKSAQVFDYLKHAGDYGLKVDNVDKDFGAVRYSFKKCSRWNE